MATFVNSFFLSQAYGFWLATKGNTRKVQGRLNDMGMLLATHAQRDGTTGKFTPACVELLTDVARWVQRRHARYTITTSKASTTCEAHIAARHMG